MSLGPWLWVTTHGELCVHFVQKGLDVGGTLSGVNSKAWKLAFRILME